MHSTQRQPELQGGIQTLMLSKETASDSCTMATVLHLSGLVAGVTSSSLSDWSTQKELVTMVLKYGTLFFSRSRSLTNPKRKETWSQGEASCQAVAESLCLRTCPNQDCFRACHLLGEGRFMLQRGSPPAQKHTDYKSHVSSHFRAALNCFLHWAKLWGIPLPHPPALPVRGQSLGQPISEFLKWLLLKRFCGLFLKFLKIYFLLISVRKEDR